MRSKEEYKDYIDAFLFENSKVNLMSKNDEVVLYEKHVTDSMAIEQFFEKYAGGDVVGDLLDIGTGGGFPSVPIAIEFPNLQVFALDSIRKKINAIENIKEVLNLKNLTTICDRAENLKGREFDFVTSRAVSTLKTVSAYALPLLKKNGYFVAYKSKKVQEEILEAKPLLARFGSKIVDVIEYKIDDTFERNLVVIKK